jgi:hypothetical protein
MSKVLVASLAAFLSLHTYSATQSIEVSSGMNFIAIELKVGENRLTDLFPSAPLGTLIFTWDNHAGWRAAQMYPFGWSQPDHKILPWQGAVMVLPPNFTNTFTLTGETVPLPRTDYAVLEGSPAMARFYRGFNLVSARAAEYIARTRSNPGVIGPREPVTLFSFNKNSANYILHQVDELDNSWSPVPPPATGAVWYLSTQAPVHPDGTFANPDTALYFNNYAPAYAIDSPFLGANCEHRSGLTAQLLRHPATGSPIPIGDPLNVSTNFVGYIDPRTNHVRYVPGDQLYSVRVEGPDFFGQTDVFTVPTMGTLQQPPVPPLGMNIGPTVPIFREQPADLTFRPGADIHLDALFHHATILDPQISLNVPFQWQKQNSNGEWTDIPGASETTLHLENIKTTDAGAYRLRATYNCKQFYSRTAILTLLAPTLFVEPQANNTMRLRVALPVSTKAVVQSSADLQEWTEEFPITNPTTEWSTEISLLGGHRFYRVQEVP